MFSNAGETKKFQKRKYDGPMLRINDALSIDESELRFAYARSSGPGGQNVNKVETKVVLLFDVGASQSLSGEQRMKIEERLRTRITRAGVLRIMSQRFRTRGANQKAVIERFVRLLGQALFEHAPRTKTKVSKGAKKRRLEAKNRRSKLKKLRSNRDFD